MSEGLVLGHIAEALRLGGDEDGASSHYQEALAILKDGGFAWMQARV